MVFDQLNMIGFIAEKITVETLWWMGNAMDLALNLKTLRKRQGNYSFGCYFIKHSRYCYACCSKSNVFYISFL